VDPVARAAALQVRTPGEPERSLELVVNQESLRELLARVHERLSDAASVDGESRELLRTLTHDIERALGGGAPAGAAPPVAGQVAASRLEGLAVEFEAGHPQLAEVLRQLIDALGKAGI
jgi:Domain of unknown function (DUF4404)